MERCPVEVRDWAIQDQQMRKIRITGKKKKKVKGKSKKSSEKELS